MAVYLNTTKHSSRVAMVAEILQFAQMVNIIQYSNVSKRDLSFLSKASSEYFHHKEDCRNIPVQMLSITHVARNFQYIQIKGSVCIYLNLEGLETESSQGLGDFLVSRLRLTGVVVLLVYGPQYLHLSEQWSG